ncbi:MAG: NAD(+)/NADH kinase [Candidatus Aenigmatarchaeota archaeon]
MFGDKTKHKNITGVIDKSLKNTPGDLIVAIGGDGTFLKAMTKASKSGVPVLCIRADESKGVLAEADLSDIDRITEKLGRGEFSLVKFCMIDGRTDNKKFTSFNEIGFFRLTEKALRFDVFVNNSLFYKNVIADGGVISTPAGSTAYNISAGGPIIDRSSESLVFTPLNPHGFNKPVVFSGSVKIIFKRHAARAFADGKGIGTLGSCIEVSKSKSYANVVSFDTPFCTRWQRIVGQC